MFVVFTLLPFILLSLAPTPSPSPPCIALRSILFVGAVVGASKVQWKGNEHVSPEHKDAHDAPRSQKYWDEHGIERPDYAKTDAELAAEGRSGRKTNGRGDGGGDGVALLGMIASVAAILSMATVAYAKITGDWDTILNNPLGAFIADCIKWMAEVTGAKGHRLGSSSRTTPNARSDVSDEDARRLARLARFDKPKDILDNMKSD